MPSNVDIVNLALTKLGANRITTMTDDLEQARVMNAIFDMVRDGELTDHNWSFAAKRAMLPALTETPLFGYDFLYELPSDCLSVVRVADWSRPWLNQGWHGWRQSDVGLYRLQSRRIETDIASPLPLLYNARIEDPNQFDPLFVQALAYRLAMETCDKITQSNTKMQLVAQGYSQAITRAIKNDSIQEPPSPMAESSWILSRR